MRMHSFAGWCFALVFAVGAYSPTSRALDLTIVASFPNTLPQGYNGYDNIKPGDWDANQFTIIDPQLTSVDQIQLLLDPSTTDDQLSHTTVAIYTENPTLIEPDTIVTGAGNIPLIFTQILLPTTTLDDRMLVKFNLQTPGIFPPAGGLPNTPINYWIVVENTYKPDEAGAQDLKWAKTSNQNVIYNDAKSASINPVQLAYLNPPGKWQHPEPGQGNQIMAFALVHAPEPSTYVLGSIMAGVLAMIGRNKAGQRKTALKPEA